LARPDEGEAAGRLLTAAHHELSDETRLLMKTGAMGTTVMRGLDGGDEAILHDVVQAVAGRPLEEVFGGLSVLLAAEDRGGELVGALTAIPPIRTLMYALDSGVDQLQVLVMAQAVIKIKGVAVAEQARRRGIGTALINRCVQLYSQLGWQMRYGQFAVGSGLEGYYSRRGFEVLDEGELISLRPLLDVPLSIHAMAGERLFMRWR